ncbi:class I SAM-dependent methyltransferase [Nocardioides coralli]|uniref:class I SAM-dependent methyltransferase n=1 Tax=Nocardioides coralli TaxID=2872154 RepID=UPI001CA3C7C7|nr:methyltransferase domain-containing protein [Nocardioides coralli]QZY29254.1 methyltransferase domain-containing protein [Nocardioides coralli]
MSTTVVTRPEVLADPLKAKHEAVWASGDYASVAREVIPSLGPALVEALGVEPGERVLDVAAGSGNAAIPAARRGADVVASDLVPRLLEQGQAEATRAGVALRWEQGDAEALPYADASFDVAMSCVGVMFAPHHQVAADELVRVTRPGGRIGLLSWTPTGFIGQMFATMRPFVPAPPAGAQPPPLWGDPDHVLALLGDRVTDVAWERRQLADHHFTDAEGFLEFFKASYGPTIAAYAHLADDPGRTAELDHALLELGRRHERDGHVTGWEYLLLTARRG